MNAWIAMACLSLVAGNAFAQDPHEWLEEVTAPKALDWAKARNAESSAALTKGPEFEKLTGRLLSILDSKEKIPTVEKRGGLYYNFWKDEKNKRGLWRRTTLEEYRKPQPTWETVLDLDALCAAEKENWVWHGANWLEPKCERVLVSVSRGGADADVVREFDPVKKEFIKDGFTLPEAKSDVTWRDADTLVIGTDFGAGSLTDSGYPRVLKVWKRGTKVADATPYYECQKADVSASSFKDQTPGFEREFVNRGITFYTSEMFFNSGGKLVKVEKPDGADAAPWRQWLLIRLRQPWESGGKTYPAGALLGTKFDDFMKGERKFEMLFEPTERRSLASWVPMKTKLVLDTLDNVRSRIEVLTEKDGAWTRTDLPGVPALSSASVQAVDADESDEYFLHVNDYLTPATMALGVAGGGPAEKLKSNPAFFDTKGLAISQHEAKSKDGTKIPYFQVSRADLKLDGTAPTLLYGYGGFEVALTPGYRALDGAGWMEAGGVYVVANIRGGGEFGPQWHQSALREKRHRCYEDFSAVADDLVARKVTSPKHLGAQGGSNGGLLMGNMLTQYPDRFGAIVCQVPLFDMKRYHKLLAGASWMAEYGDPDKPEDWKFIETFSPYHLLKKDAKYPRILFTTSTRDDRVHPGHARKAVARLKEMGHDVLYYENIEGGHGGSADNKQRAFMQALAYVFLWKQLK